MPRIAFTQNIQRHVACPVVIAEGDTVREVLECAFAANPKARGYVLDDQGAIRKHIVVFVDGKPIDDRAKQSDPVGPAGEVYVMQALSGG